MTQSAGVVTTSHVTLTSAYPGLQERAEWAAARKAAGVVAISPPATGGRFSSCPGRGHGLSDAEQNGAHR